MTAHLDIIGDIHGHAAKLRNLLLKLGCKEQAGYFRQPGRTVIFLGDLIDRGKENFKTIDIVKAMVDNRQALIVMGNHEYNALCYHTKDSKGHYLRKHSEKNFRQHKEVLEEIADKGEKKWQHYLDWFKRMPLFLNISGIRIVHACWDQGAVDFIMNSKTRDKAGRLTKNFLVKSVKKGTVEFKAVETLLKGKEIGLPETHPGILDKDGNLRKRVRVKWWLPEEQWQDVETYDRVTRINDNSLKELAEIRIPGSTLEQIKREQKKAVEGNSPVFFGHYWFTGRPQLLTKNAACLDYSVGRGGKLVCYRYDGEEILDEAKFVYV